MKEDLRRRCIVWRLARTLLEQEQGVHDLGAFGLVALAEHGAD
jgi:hypothetical protein